MFGPFKLKKTMGSAHNVDPEDVLNTKRALNDLDFMPLPKYGLTPYPDMVMIDGIRSFQRRHGLRGDGVMKPDGPTLERLNETLVLAGGPGDLVQVDAYKQNRDGNSVAVSSHTRSAPGSGGGSATVKGGTPKAPGMKPPVPNARIRDKDDWGEGAYGAGRTNPDGTVREHKGVDVVTTPGETVVSPVDGAYVRPAQPYADDPRYSGVVIKGEDGSEVKVLYVDPAQGLKPGDKVEAGKTPIGTAQDITKKYPATSDRKPITNHVHIQVKKDGQFIDPTGAVTGQK